MQKAANKIICEGEFRVQARRCDGLARRWRRFDWKVRQRQIPSADGHQKKPPDFLATKKVFSLVENKETV